MLRCSEIMRRPLGGILPSSSILAVARAMRDEQVGFFAVVDEAGHAVGVVTDRDIVVRACAVGLPLHETPIATIMTREMVTCRDTDSLTKAMDVMKRKQTSRILLLDAQKKLAGVLSITDLAQYAEPLAVSGLLRSVCSREFRVTHACG